jgi:hypothetical protein
MICFCRLIVGFTEDARRGPMTRKLLVMLSFALVSLGTVAPDWIPILSKPTIAEEVISPNGEYRAVIFFRSATNATHTHYWNVSVLPVGAALPVASGNVLSTDSEYVPCYRTVTARWLGPTRLELTYHPRVTPKVVRTSVGAVRVSVMPRGTTSDYRQRLEELVEDYLSGATDIWVFADRFTGYYVDSAERKKHAQAATAAGLPYVLTDQEHKFFDDVRYNAVYLHEYWFPSAYDAYKAGEPIPREDSAVE